MASQSLGLKRVQKSLVSPKSSNHLERSNITTDHLACLHRLAVSHSQFSLFILFLSFPSPCLISSAAMTIPNCWNVKLLGLILSSVRIPHNVSLFPLYVFTSMVTNLLQTLPTHQITPGQRRL